MTYTTEKIFEKYEVRKTAKQRAEFRRFVEEVAEAEGYDCLIETAGNNARNIVVGDPKSAKVVFTAHYDTCAVTPFPNFITPKCMPLYILYQVLICVCLYTVPVLVMTLLPSLILKWGGSGALATWILLLGYVLLFLACFLMVAGPANKHTANDNTSGVSVLLDLLQDMPGAYREDVAFIFFDLEERGCVGSQYYRKKHARDMKRKFVLNFDCVGDGKNMLFVVKNKARPYIEMLEKAFPSTDTISTEIAYKGVFYPSDQRSFEHGVGVGAFKKTEKGLLYLDRIHTKYDTKFDEENIDYLVRGSISLIENWDFDEEEHKKTFFTLPRKNITVPARNNRTKDDTDSQKEEATDTPTEKSKNAPTEKSEDAPVEESVDTPTEESIDAPTEESADAPTENGDAASDTAEELPTDEVSVLSLTENTQSNPSSTGEIHL